AGGTAKRVGYRRLEAGRVVAVSPDAALGVGHRECLVPQVVGGGGDSAACIRCTDTVARPVVGVRRDASGRIGHRDQIVGAVVTVGGGVAATIRLREQVALAVEHPAAALAFGIGHP